MGIFGSTATTNSHEEVSIRMIQLKTTTRLNYEERAFVKRTFDRLQDSGLLPFWQFRTTIVGTQIPESICLRLYEIFSSQSISQVVHELEECENAHNIIPHGMNYEDLQ